MENKISEEDKREMRLASRLLSHMEETVENSVDEESGLTAVIVALITLYGERFNVEYVKEAFKLMSTMFRLMEMDCDENTTLKNLIKTTDVCIGKPRRRKR